MVLSSHLLRLAPHPLVLYNIIRIIRGALDRAGDRGPARGGDLVVEPGALLRRLRPRPRGGDSGGENGGWAGLADRSAEKEGEGG